MKEIELTRGYVAIVDDEDYEDLSQLTWCADNKSTGAIYARHNLKMVVGHIAIYMHREVMKRCQGLPDGSHVDHINRNTLDNRRVNLRLATNQENQFNRGKVTGTSSHFKGVCWSKNRNKWRSQITIDGKQKHLGWFTDELEGAEAYNQAAVRLFGEFANLNDLTLGYSVIGSPL